MSPVPFPTLSSIVEYSPLGSKVLNTHSVKASLPRNCLTSTPDQSDTTFLAIKQIWAENKVNV